MSSLGGPTIKKNHSIFVKRLGHISFLGRFLNGKPVGTAWLGLLGNGFLTGDADVKNPGKISSDNAAYIYPGFEMALVGKFQENFMISGTHIFTNFLFPSVSASRRPCFLGFGEGSAKTL